MDHLEEYIELLQSLIRTLSLSGSEQGTGDILASFFNEKGIAIERLHNNIIARNKYYQEGLPLLILNSHHDTVKIGDGWLTDPLGAQLEGDFLYGRGSNDAGGSLVSLIAAFCHYYDARLPYNLILIASGEEENFGPNGVSSVLKDIDVTPDLAIIGEPTEMHLGVAEKGLIVIDATTTGISGHAARSTGTNALYLAIEDISKIRNYNWVKVSSVLGTTKTTVTQISSGSQHNVIPDRCTYVIDCRVNEHYTLEEVLDQLNDETHAQLTPRSLRWHPSGINLDHVIVQKAKSLNRDCFGSPTLSDQVHFTCPSVKMGPGMSERSHTADEYIKVSEIEEGIRIYIDLLDGLDITAQ